MSAGVLASAAPAAAVPADDSYRNRYIIAFTVVMASVMELIDTSIVNVAIPHMMGNLGATVDQIAWVSTGYIVANVIVLPVTGWLSAYFGRTRYFAFSIALFTVASFFCGNSNTLTELVFWRIAQGLGGGALLSTSQAILYEVFPREEYGVATAMFGVGLMLGPTVGPTLGGWITDVWSWPWIFYINIPFGLLALALTFTYIRNSRFAQKAGRVDALGLALLAIGIGTLQTMLERGERQDWFASREIVAYAATSAISLVWFVWHELHTEHPVIDLRVLQIRQFAAGTAFSFVIGLALYATVFVLPLYLQQVLGFTANQSGLVILPGALASAFVMASMARLAGRVDPRLMAVSGSLLFTFSMTRWAQFTTLSGHDDFFWPLILRGLGLGLVMLPTTNLSMAGLPLPKIPAGTGLFNLMRQLGGSVGIALSAFLLQHFTEENRAILAEHVSRYDEVTRERLAAMTHALVARGTPAPLAEGQAIAILDLQVRRQATMISIEHIFMLFGVVFLIGLPLILSMKWKKGSVSGGGAH